MEICPRCGRPLERADDFWYCDNPDCPASSMSPRSEECDLESGTKTKPRNDP
jgi:hypothetical protein